MDVVSGVSWSIMGLINILDDLIDNENKTLILLSSVIVLSICAIVLNFIIFAILFLNFPILLLMPVCIGSLWLLVFSLLKMRYR